MAELGDVSVEMELDGQDDGFGGPVRFGDYELRELLGRGGMGEVVLAHDEWIGREVALKRMRRTAPDVEAERRFLREAKIQARLQHPAIVPVHQLGRDADGRPYFTMKRLAGVTLQELLGGPPQRLLRAFAEVCLAIEFAHEHGVIHRDLKPTNIMLGDFGEVYVLDWGVALVVGDGSASPSIQDIAAAAGETQVGAVMGTPGYMAPEQALGYSMTPALDVYALGCVLFEILSGEPLHPRGVAGMRSALAGPDARPSQRAPGRAIPPELDALCVAATATERDQRIPRARELGDRVQRFLDGDRDLARRRDLARAHLARAQAAFNEAHHEVENAVHVAGGGNDELHHDTAAGDDDFRRTAMREAAAALALDPALDGAAALVGRLMIEPPRTTPPEVERAIADDEVLTVRANARGGLWALIACVGFTPLLWWISPPGHHYVLAFSGALAISGLLYLYAYGGAPKPGLVIVGNVLMIAMLARMFSPILVAPGVASVLGLALVVTPQRSRVGSPIAVSLLYIAATLIPLALERLDAVSRTVSITTAGILLHAPAVGAAETPTLVVCVLYIVGLIIGTCWMAHAMRTRARAAHRHLHLQAWQLRQLVPS
jgi:tRNA A-37 threonylcarbamoyl transferase component Bud32